MLNVHHPMRCDLKDVIPNQMIVADFLGFAVLHCLSIPGT